ncbi:acetylornithine/N-succinyldiaminopimelate aminotransferase [Paenibacillus phyllosphaerae]|uniref:Acetylornithine/N-succinyldiaminopimelate aminotransferase n=1 Tax=Paenibacillus phyllosphaerae TaxID=274593 RepID=A0A7W5AX63_9BACL|nr:acetylornithine/succinylornithine family transaminase [Paenibacillus phyllosphaerae]MBB3110222.1 acetylornithine/N-succinyldiaminopimelate aminotransferase [Paenibacillus phyllosphaerae]
MNDLQWTTQELLEEAGKTILFTAHRPDVVMERGEGMYLWDTEGKSYLDFVGGWAVTCLGHSPVVLQEALAAQAAQLVNASPSFLNRPMVELASLLVQVSCFERVFFTSTGAEANESAIKLARKYGKIRRDGAHEIITMTNAFHGRTLAAMAATGKPQWETLFTPRMPGFKHVPYNDYEACAAAVDENTCAIMLELIQGEGGVVEAELEYVRKLRSLCDDKGILLIVDEIQTGLGRTGKLFAYEHYGIEPDIMTLAKGIGGGFPLSAMLTKEAYNIFEPGDQGGTYTGQPLGMAAGLAVVQTIVSGELSAQAQRLGDYLMGELRLIAGRYGLTKLRGKGLLVAFDLPGEYGPALVDHCRSIGLLVNAPKPATIRLMPALIVEEADIDRMVELLCSALDELKTETIQDDGRAAIAR